MNRWDKSAIRSTSLRTSDVYLENMRVLGFICLDIQRGEISFWFCSLLTSCDVYHILVPLLIMNKTNLFSTIFVKRFAELKVFFLIIFQQLNTDFFKLEFLIFFFTVLSVHCYTRSSLVLVSRSCSLTWAFHCSGLSRCWSSGSRVCGLNSRSSRALEHRLNSYGAQA